jgi:Transposase DDE domain
MLSARYSFMKKITENILRQHLNLNLARIKALAAMVMAIIAARNVQLSAIARYFPASNKPDSAFKRMQRFLAQVMLPRDKVALLVLAILGFKQDEKMTLILDRTNWKFGRAHLNILFLGIAHNGAAVPLFVKVLKDKKQGNSSYMDRIELMEEFISLLGRTRIRCVLGDREFVGKQWVIWLRKMRIPFVMRLPEKATNIALQEDNFGSSRVELRDLKKGKKRFFGYCLVGETDSYKACVSALRSYKDELVVLVHSDDIREPFSYYRERWKIESMFRILKTGGFNLESTHVVDPQRLCTLLSVLSIAFCFALKAGRIAVADGEDTLKKTDIWSQIS